MASDSASCIPTVDDKDVAISADLCAGSTAAGSTPVGEDVNCPLDGSDQTAAAAPAATDGVVSLPVVEDVPNKEKNPNLCGKGAKFCESVESDAAHHPVAVQQSQGGANFAPRSKRTSQPTDTPAFSPNNLPAGGFPAGVVHPWSSSGRGAQQIPPMPPPSMPPPNLYQPPIMIPTLVPNMHTLMAPFLPGMGPVAAPPGFVPPQTPCPPLTFPTPLSGPIGMPVPPVMMHKPPNLAMFPTVFPDGSVTSSQPSLMKQEQSAPLSPSPNARVTVGNALLAAQMWNEPPKFSCVLLSGIPAVGKTTMGRELVNELREDGLGWVFFSGADFIATATGKRAVWETTKEVFDALEKRLDELLEQQREKRDVKGLVIDKNVKNVEEIFYLAALLRSKQIPFVGIIGLEAENDDVLLERIGEGQEPREKLKYRRIIHSRIRRLAREAGMYHQVDATKSKQEVLHALRTKVLGCCAQPPHRDIQPDLHVDSTSISMVDSHAEYYAVVAKVSELLKPAACSIPFPPITEYAPLWTRDLTDKVRIDAFKERYAVRRYNSGIRYLLLCQEGQLYLISTHLGAVHRLSSGALLGNKAVSTGYAILEGDLVQVDRGRRVEMFLVFDVLYRSNEAGCEVNLVTDMSWQERQDLLSSLLTNESNAVFPENVDCVVAHRSTVKLEEIPQLLEPCRFPSDGIIFQPVTPVHGVDKTYLWCPPTNITVDFRIGALKSTIEENTATVDVDSGTQTKPITANDFVTTGGVLQQAQSSTAANQAGRSTSGPGALDRSHVNENTPIRVFELEVYDKYEKEYTQFESSTVAVKNPDVVEGCICTCVLVDEKKRKWAFQRIRYDALRPAYKKHVASLLEYSIIPKARLLKWLTDENIVPAKTVPSVVPIQDPSKPPTEMVAPPFQPLRVGAPPTYESAVRMQQNGVQPNALEALGVAAGSNVSFDAGFTAEPMRGGHPTLMSTASVGGAGALGKKPLLGHGTSYDVHGLLGVSSIKENALKRDASTITSPGSALCSVVGSKTTPEQLQLLTSMVQSLNIVRKEEQSDRTIQWPTAVRRANHRDHTPVPITPERCMECRKRKRPEDLHISSRDRMYYCYDCWAKAGWEHCNECGEFKEGYHERTRQSVGEFYCNDCWSNFAKREARDNKDGGATESRAERSSRKSGRKRHTGREGENDEVINSSSSAAKGQSGTAGRRHQRKKRTEEKDSVTPRSNAKGDRGNKHVDAAGDVEVSATNDEGVKAEKSGGSKGKSNRRSRRKEATKDKEGIQVVELEEIKQTADGQGRG